MKLNQQVWVAVNDKSEIASGCEGYLISQDKEYLIKEMQAWNLNPKKWQPILVRICPQNQLGKKK